MTETGKQLALYQYDGCWYCRRVDDALAKLGLFIEHRNILRDPEHRRALVEARGRSTVPVLRIVHEDGREEWMPESRDIIRYLNAHYGPAVEGAAESADAGDRGLLSRLLGRS